MKANQNFRAEDEAVSPVIGVILMVAITVVLAAVVFVLVSDLGSTEESAPNISFSKQASQDRLQVTTADPDADWGDINISVVDGACDSTAADFLLSTGGSTTALASGSAAGSDGDTVGAGDYIQVSPGADGCSFSLTHTPTNSLLGTWDFA